MGLDLGAALSNLANKISGGDNGSAGNVGSTNNSGSVRSTGNAGGGYSGVNRAVETAIGEQLSGKGYEAESAKSIEEKASAALDNLMESLGLSGSEADEALEEIGSAIKDEIEAREDETAVDPKNLPEGWSVNDSGKILDQYGNIIGRVETTKEDVNGDKIEDTIERFYLEKAKEADEVELDPEVEAALDDMTDEELEALKKAIEEEQEDRKFTDEEAATFAAGEEEVQARVKEAIENNPDMDPAEVEAKVREAYELENPEYAKAAEEAAAVLEEHDAAMDEAYAAYQEENPMPNEADYSNPSEYLAAMEEWSAAAKEHMDEQEAKYREENENYDNLMDAVEWENKNDGILEKIKEYIKDKEPSILDPIYYKKGDLPKIDELDKDKIQEMIKNEIDNADYIKY